MKRFTAENARHEAAQHLKRTEDDPQYLSVIEKIKAEAEKGSTILELGYLKKNVKQLLKEDGFKIQESTGRNETLTTITWN